MNLIGNFQPHRILLIACLAIFTISNVADALNPLFPDFPGPYCAQSKQCCKNRQDSCALRIADTLCYCDDFCTRDRSSDCCPDYASYCRKEPEASHTCYYNGKYYRYPQAIRENCNSCKCGMYGQMECTDHVCLTDEALINNVNLIKSSLGWEARNYSEFWGRKLKEGLKLRLGTLEPSSKVKSMARLSNKATTLPRHFNAVSHWGLTEDIMDQGWCGTSWLMSTTSVASDRFVVHSKGRETPQLSPQTILACARKSRGCSGGRLDVAWRYLNKKGVVDDDCYPYDPNNTQCKLPPTRDLQKAGCALPTNVPRRDFYRMGPAYSLNNETDIMVEIMESGPVQATMRVYRDFFSYSRGVYRHSAASRNEEYGFHSVRLVGWGEEPGYNPTKYWIAANSWGDWWGEDGFFRILRGSNECLIEDYVLASWPHVYDDLNSRRRRRRRNQLSQRRH